MKFGFPRQIFEKYSSNIVQIRPVVAELLHADGQTGMELIVAFRSVANAPKILWGNGKGSAGCLFWDTYKSHTHTHTHTHNLWAERRIFEC